MNVYINFGLSKQSLPAIVNGHRGGGWQGWQPAKGWQRGGLSFHRGGKSHERGGRWKL